MTPSSIGADLVGPSPRRPCRCRIEAIPPASCLDAPEQRMEGKLAALVARGDLAHPRPANRALAVVADEAGAHLGPDRAVNASATAALQPAPPARRARAVTAAGCDT